MGAVEVTTAAVATLLNAVNDTAAPPVDPAEEVFEPLHHPESENNFFHFDETGTPLAILGWILLIGLLKAVLYFCKRIPHSVVLLGLGIVAGAGLSRVYEEELFLRPQWFFYYMLPPIVLEAGYFLKNKEFFSNIGTITTFAIVGTMLNTMAIALTLYGCRGWFSTDLSFIEILLFAVLICAVDPVAVLCVFEDIHVNELLYICVFGESLLNDAVTIVLYNTIISLLTSATPVAGVADAANMASAALNVTIGPMECIYGVFYFFKVSLGGIACGIAGGYATVFAMRMVVNYQQIQPINLIACPIVVYLLTESMHLSAILALVVIGIVVKNYMAGNVSDQMRGTCEFLIKQGSSYSESLVFVFLGVSVVSPSHVFDIGFILVTLAGCLIYRFIFVYFLCFIINRFRCEQTKISYEDQFVMAYGGIRGAVCYGLVIALDQSLIPAKRMFVTTTLIVILFTTAFQGSTIRWLVEQLQVKRSRNFGKEPEKKRVVDYFIGETNRHLRNYLEDLIGLHGQNWVYRKFLEKDREWIKPWLIANYTHRDADIVIQHQKLEIDEYACNIKGQGGSFAGLPTVSSLAEMAHSGLPKSKSEAVLLPRLHETYVRSSSFFVRVIDIVAPDSSSGRRGRRGGHVPNRKLRSPEVDQFSPEVTERSNLLPVPPPSQRSMPRNESLSFFVREAFETAAQKQGRNSLRDNNKVLFTRHHAPQTEYHHHHCTPFAHSPQRRSLYSRHLMDFDYCDDDDSSGDEYDNAATYPSSKYAGTKMATQMRTFGRNYRDSRHVTSPRFARGAPGRTSMTERVPQSSPRDTAPPRPRLSLPTPDEFNLKQRRPPKISFSVQDETIPAEGPSSARHGRKVSGGRKTFYVGSGEDTALAPIREEPSFLHPENARSRRERTFSSNN